ncbi:MAG TPA: TonB-dependent receptor [Ferruginibacter sp.]|nr:TonB-dependent receptor [Ferruginibacter sp.]HPH90082.1 TonB-dependent receptor [Ferruginibacter sp.]
MSKVLSVLSFILIISIQSFAQQTIKGVVTDSSGNGIKGVNILTKGNKKGVQTKDDGSFSINVKESGTVNLVVSAVGYKSIIVSASDNKEVSIMLTLDVVVQDEVVVNVGYGTLRKRDVTVAASSIGAKDLKDMPMNNAAEALNGRLAGVTAAATEGSPEADIKIKVRGGTSITQDNAPLYIIDGIQVESGLNSLSVQDIQSIDVLKDASATAIYGARGANGVVIVTTKSGKQGKVKLNYSGFVGVKTLRNQLEVLNPQEYLEFMWERAHLVGSDDITSFKNRYVGTYDSIAIYARDSVMPVNWQEEVMGRKALTTTHILSASGGTKKFTYNASYTYNREQGIAINSDYKRNLGNIKLEFRPASKIKIGVSGRYNDQVIDGVSTSNEGGASLNRLRQVIKYKPFISFNEKVDEFDEDQFIETNGNSLGLINSVVLMRSEIRRKHQALANGSISFQYSFSKKLTFKTTAGYDYTRIRQTLFSDSVTADSRIYGAGNPILNLDSTTRKVLNISNVLTWNVKNYKKSHDFGVLVGQEIYNQWAQTQYHRRRDIPTFTTPKQAISDGSLGKVDSGSGFPRRAVFNSKQLSFFSKVNYTFRDKYLFNATIRYDGSSKFNPDDRWGFFPAASVAWRVSREKFIQKVKWLNDLKIRAGYGESGNNRVLDYSYLTTFGPFNPYSLNNQNVTTLAPGSQLSNYFIQWETNVSRNLGIDATLFNNRVEIIVDLYRNSAENLLLQAPVSTALGYINKIKNAGATVNKGIELQLNLVPVKTKNFTWNFNLNNSWNRNEIKGLTAGIDTQLTFSGWSPAGLEDFAAIVGSPVGSMYGFVTDGFYKASDFHAGGVTGVYVLNAGVVKNGLYSYASGAAAGTDSTNLIPGALKLKDLNGDGVVNAADRTIIGNPNPKFTGGLSQQFSYKNFDLSIFVNWSVGGDVMNANRIEFSNMYTPWANATTDIQGRWRTINAQGEVVTDLNQLAEINKDATSWVPLRSGNNSFILHSWAIEDGSFLRLNNITFGYTFPKKSLSRIGIQSLRLYATANNVAVITGYSGYDPEVSTRNKANTYPTPNVDYSAYPRSRSFIFGVNASF